MPWRVSSAQKQGFTQELASHRASTASTPEEAAFQGGEGMLEGLNECTVYRNPATGRLDRGTMQRTPPTVPVDARFDAPEGTATVNLAPGEHPPVDASSSLLDRLRDLKRKDEEGEVESTAARTLWLEAVDMLMRAVRAWMLPAVQEGLARLDVATVHVAQDDVGAYDAPALKIALPGARIVWVRPVGTLRVGAKGIVDVVCGSNRALLVLNRAGVWKIRSAGPTSTLVLLDGHTFAKALGDLIL